MENKDLIEQIIQGTQTEEQVTIKYDGADYTFTLKPLTTGQLSKLKKIEQSGLKVRMDKKGQTEIVPINAGEMAEAQEEAKYEGISFSVDAPVEKVKQLPQSVVDDLFKEIIRISELTDKDLVVVRNFQ